MKGRACWELDARSGVAAKARLSLFLFRQGPRAFLTLSRRDFLIGQTCMFLKQCQRRRHEAATTATLLGCMSHSAYDVGNLRASSFSKIDELRSTLSARSKVTRACARQNAFFTETRKVLLESSRVKLLVHRVDI